MKKLFALLMILPVIMLTACVPQEMQSTSSGSVPPLTYDSMEEFISERYPEETFFDIEKVEIEKTAETN